MAIKSIQTTLPTSTLFLKTPRRATYGRGAAVVALAFSDALVGLGIWGAVLALAAARALPGLTEATTLGVTVGLTFWVALRLLLGLYPGYGIDPARELKLQTHSSVFTLVLVSFAAAVFGAGDHFFSLLALLVAALGLIVVGPLARWGTRELLIRKGWWGRPVVVLGTSGPATRLAQTLLEDRGQGLKPAAIFSDPEEYAEAEWTPDSLPAGMPVLGNLDGAVAYAQASGINTAVLAVEGESAAGSSELADWAGLNFERVIRVVPGLKGFTGSAMVTQDLVGTLGIEVTHNLLSRGACRTKRILDLFGVLVGGALIAPIVLALIVLIKLDSPGPVFFGQTRLGDRGREFRCWKFRTMRQDAETVLADILEGDPVLRMEWELTRKLHDDPRITRMGRFLRKTSLDELPQLWNVLRGEMSLVGPRPIVNAEVPKYKRAYALYTRVTPGITGLWQTRGRSDTTYGQRVAFDTYYVRNWSVWLDIVILMQTVVAVALRRGAC